MHSEPSTLLTVLAWISLGLGFGSAVAVLIDIFALGNRQHMWIMEVVYPVTALYLGPVLLWFYARHGRETSGGGEDDSGDEEEVRWWHVAKGVTHCGAGCTLGDIIGEWLIFTTGFSIAITGSVAAHTLWADLLVDFALAWGLGILFQYFSIAPMRDVTVGQGVIQAIKADTLSIVSFQLGLFAYMALYHLVLWKPPLAVDTAAYWFMMQIGMIVGFATAYPVNRWLIATGIKERM